MRANNTSQRVQQAIDNEKVLWLPYLAKLLVQTWSEIEGAALNQYVTSQYFSEGKLKPRSELSIYDGDGNHVTVIEVLDVAVENAYCSLGLRFLPEEVAINSSSSEIIGKALSLAVLGPTLRDSVAQLARRSHLLYVESAGIDMSHSDPLLPLSVFISIPHNDEKDVTLRLAENFVHEAMHLQLSLMEKFSPMVKDPSIKYFSPWRNCDRPVGGVLHGLYVFGVIHQWLGQHHQFCEFSQKRRSEIEMEVQELLHFPASHGLTDLGQSLARKVIDAVRSG